MSEGEVLKSMLENEMLDNNIKMFFHCALCAREIPAGVSPQDWVKNESGWTTDGFQVWCIRHQCNVIHVDFEGAKHPAYLERKPTPVELRSTFKVAGAVEPKRKKKKVYKKVSGKREFDKEFDELYARLGNTIHRFNPMTVKAVVPMVIAELVTFISDGNEEELQQHLKTLNEDILACVRNLQEVDEK